MRVRLLEELPIDGVRREVVVTFHNDSIVTFSHDYTVEDRFDHSFGVELGKTVGESDEISLFEG
jgi:hypothetical protein